VHRHRQLSVYPLIVTVTAAQCHALSGRRLIYLCHVTRVDVVSVLITSCVASVGETGASEYMVWDVDDTRLDDSSGTDGSVEIESTDRQTDGLTDDVTVSPPPFASNQLVQIYVYF